MEPSTSEPTTAAGPHHDWPCALTIPHDGPCIPARQQDDSALRKALERLVALFEGSYNYAESSEALDQANAALAALPPSAPPAPADSWRDTGNRGAAEHLARQKPER